ncbi:MAG: LysR substrate-binding domain-containing protein [Oceanisphaera sp.]|uniref:LysR substrate-binding domain-containing protein n=1 Tax=Oceanisphaera sp. TaxID=1929979 RepID=UPI003C743DC3
MKTPKHLNALRAFEATARLGNFKAAADEIGVTPEAIGQLVRTLESYFCIQLFIRNKGGKKLTATQETLNVLPSLSEAFRCLSSVTDRLNGLSKSGALTISTSPSITSKWLVPILPKILNEESDIDVKLDITNRLIDLTTGEFDIVIRYAEKAENWSSFNVTSLAENEKLLAVCCPNLLKSHPEIAGISGLLKQTLIRDITMENSSYPNWREWLNKVGVTEFDNTNFLEVNASLVAIEMAKLSQGVALVREHLVHSEIAAGTLINLYPNNLLSTNWGYYIITPLNPRSQVKFFANWLEKELKLLL